jgi:hypothetical protein
LQLSFGVRPQPGIVVNVEWLHGEVCTRVWAPVPGGIVVAFQFGLAAAVVACPWRLLENDRLVLGRSDFGNLLRGGQPVDVAHDAFALLKDRPVVGGRIDMSLGDFVIEFQDGVRLEVFNDASSNESWKMGSPHGPSLVATRGGQVQVRS